MKGIRKMLFGEVPRERLKSRQILSLESLYEDFSARHRLRKDLWLELWMEIASMLDVDPGKLRCADRFEIELSFSDGMFGVNTTAESLEEWAQFRLDQLKGVVLDGTNIRSVEDLLVCVSGC
jgi:hypothetical protein